MNWQEGLQPIKNFQREKWNPGDILPTVVITADVFPVNSARHLRLDPINVGIGIP